jgi:hypothetical protein
MYARCLFAAGALLVVTCFTAVAQTTRFPGDSPNTNETFDSGTAPRFGPQGMSGVGVPRARYGSSYQVDVYGYGGAFYGGGYPYYHGGNPYYYGDGGWYSPAVCPYCGFPTYDCRCGPPIILPPAILDPSQLYGQRAIQRLMGVEPSTNRPPMSRLERRQQAQAIADAAPRPGGNRAAQLPAVGVDPRAKAWKYIDYGDRYFKEGKFRDALTRYRKAIAADPMLADARFRQGFAELASQRYPQAVTALRRGLALDPNWPHGDFILEEVFDDVVKVNIEQALRARLTLSPNDADARFLLGVVRHFDGRPEEAQREFQQVEKLTGGAEHARAFLAVNPPVGEEKIKP